jgi:hypothetical protein
MNKRRSEVRQQTFPIEGQWADTERQSEPGGSVGEIIIDARWGG